MGKEKFLHAVAGQTFWNLAVHSLAILLSWLLSYVAVIWLSGSFAVVRQYQWLAITILTIAILLIGIKIYIRNSRSIPVFPKAESDFLILDKEISIRFHSLEDIRYRKKFTLKALRKGLDRYTDKYKWSGDGEVRVRSGHDEHQLRLTHRSALWQWYDLCFDRMLNKGDTIDIEVIWQIEDKNKTAIPFISTTVEEPTESLKMELWAAESFGIRQATCDHKSNNGFPKTAGYYSNQGERRTDYMADSRAKTFSLL